MSNPTRISVHRDCGGDLLEDYEDAYLFEGEDALLFGEIVPRILCAKCGQEILGDAENQFVGAAAYLKGDRP